MHIALVTGGALPELATAADAPLVDALTQRGVEVSRPRWDDIDVVWSGFDAAVVRTTWDYAPRRNDFVAWAVAASAATRLWNPADVLRWNTHKSYLLELEERGAPVVPTAWLGRGDRIALADVLDHRGWKTAIVKPAVGASSHGLFRVDAAAIGSAQAQLDRLLAEGDALVQPYLDAIEHTGELSVVIVDGEVSHAVRKRPASGDFRVQPSLGGTAERAEPDRPTQALARWVVEATGVELLLARIDLIPDATGALQLVELEATEPNLYLSAVPDAAGQVADAIVRRARG